MIEAAYIAGGLLLGYSVSVAMFLVATLGLASAAPAFAVRGYRLRTGYKLLQQVLWMGCTFAGGFAAALVVGDIYTLGAAALLAAVLIAVLWKNSWEARQRGLAHQLLMSMATVTGVGLGFVMAHRFFPSLAPW